VVPQAADILQLNNTRTSVSATEPAEIRRPARPRDIAVASAAREPSPVDDDHAVCSTLCYWKRFHKEAVIGGDDP